MACCVAIVDYGVGNLFSVKRALEVCGVDDICVSDSASDLLKADKIILPGVGAFEDGMNGLRERNLIKPLIQLARSGKPILGICLGMQLLASKSEEFGSHDGLSLIPGNVKAIPRLGVNGELLKVPFIGWAPLLLNDRHHLNESCVSGAHGKSVYLIHSFQFHPNNPDYLLASYHFGGHNVTAAVKCGNITGVQFHPEKSGNVGLSVLRRFIYD